MAFEDKMASLERKDVGFNLIYLQTGLDTFKPQDWAGSAREGLLVVFVVAGIDAEYERLLEEGVPVVTAIETEPWGERYFQTEDPNGVIIQLVEWVTPPEPDARCVGSKTTHRKNAGEGAA